VVKGGIPKGKANGRETCVTSRSGTAATCCCVAAQTEEPFQLESANLIRQRRFYTEPLLC